MNPSNPNGANQYQLDPRQKLCWDAYIDPRSKTFSNAYQSAMDAGYEESYAAVITTRPWFEEKVRRIGLLSKAEKALEQALDLDPTKPNSIDKGMMSIKLDAAKFVAETQGKDEGYSKRKELTAKDGADFKHGLTPQEQEKLLALGENESTET